MKRSGEGISGTGLLEHLARGGADFIHPGSSEATEALVACLELAPGLRVLEVGCGTGATLVRLAEEPVELCGVDAMSEMVAAAERRLGLLGLRGRVAVTAVPRDGRWPFEAESFDRVYAESVLGFQPRAVVDHLMHEIARVVRPGGLVVVNDAVWVAGVDPKAATELNQASFEEFGLYAASEDPWSADDWIREYEKRGLLVRSAHLLDELLAERRTSKEPGGRHRLRPLLSRLWSRAAIAGARLRTDFRLRDRHIRERLASWEQRHKLVESRLFVLEKAVEPGSS